MYGVFDFAVLSDGVKSDSGSGGSGNHSLTEEKSEKTRIVGEKTEENQLDCVCFSLVQSPSMTACRRGNFLPGNWRRSN